MDWSKLLEQVLITVLPILAATLAAWVAAQIKVKLAEFAAAQPKEADVLHDFAYKAVRAAEQAGLGGLITDKKNYALEALKGYLELHNIHIDPIVLDAAIEEAVATEFNWPDIYPDPNPETPAARG